MTFSNQDKYLCLFGHPDDDVFISGTMKLLLDNGAELHAAWVTSGDFFGLGARRERELARATAILGLAKSRVHRLRFPDLSVLARLDEAADKVAELMDRVKPSIVLADAFEGGHPDHDSTNFLAYEGSYRANISAKIIEFPLYNASGYWYHWWWRINSFPPGGPPVQYSRLNDAAVTCKHRMIRSYSSQWMYMGPARLRSSRSRMINLGEPYRICPADRDHAVPPHGGRLSYERWFNSFMKTRFAQFRDQVLRVRQRPPSPRPSSPT